MKLKADTLYLVDNGACGATVEALRERLANDVLRDVGEEFSFDLFWYLVNYGYPRTSGGIEAQKAREFLDRARDIAL